MQTVYAQVNGGALTGLDDLILNLLLYLGYNLLNACGVDAAVGNQLVQCQTGNLRANGIKG